MFIHRPHCPTGLNLNFDGAMGKRAWPLVMVVSRWPIRIESVDVEAGSAAPVPGSEGLFSPRLSPDGRTLVALTHDSFRLLARDMATGTWREVAASSRWLTYPAWSADGRHLFVSDGRARIKRTMWSRRAQEYEAKINSGDLIAIAEVVRDLYRSESQPEQSYSERQLYEAALDRMAREIAAVEKLDERGAVQRITDVLAKSARGRRLASDEAEEEKAA